jgi:hypothetical protein
VGRFRQFENAHSLFTNLYVLTEKLVRLDLKKFQRATKLRHFADLRSVDILRTRFSSDPSIQKAGL